jgi:hypothetical protein
MYSMSDLASLITTVYGVLFFIASALVLWLVRPWALKVAVWIALAAAFAFPVITAQIEQNKRIAHNNMIAERFMKLCRENAGDKIYKTVDGVRGFLIMRPRQPTKDLQEYLDQYWMGDPYGHSDLEAEKPEHVFLSDRPGFKGGDAVITPINGYDYIELPYSVAADPAQQLYVQVVVVGRSTDSHGERHVEYERTINKTRLSRYAIDWEDISTLEDRRYWIAGGRTRVVDLETSEILAVRTGYVIDTEQGARAGGGIPWLIAQRNACPAFESATTKTKEFVTKVLKPTRESNHVQ